MGTRQLTRPSLSSCGDCSGKDPSPDTGFLAQHSKPCGVALLTLSLSLDHLAQAPQEPAPCDAVGHLYRHVPSSVSLRELLSGSLQGLLTHTPLGHHWQLLLPAPSLCTWGGSSWRAGPGLTHAQIPAPGTGPGPAPQLALSGRTTLKCWLQGPTDW